MKIIHSPFLILFNLFLLFFCLIGCQFKTYQQVPDQIGVLAVVNVKEPSVSFLNTETGAQVAKWKADFPFSRILLMPDQQNLMFYGKNNANVTLINMSTGKQTAQWKVGEGIANAVLSSDGKTVYFANKNLNQVLIYDLQGKSKGSIPVGESPFTMIPTPDGLTLFVFHLNGNSLSVVDLKSQKVKGTLPTNQSPMGGLYIPEHDQLWVGGHGAGDVPEKSISILSLQEGRKISEIPAPLMPVDFIQLDAKNAYVLSHGTNTLYRFDIPSGKENGNMQLGANPLGLAGGANKLYVSSYDSNQVFQVDPLTLKVLKVFNVGSGPLQIVLREGVGK